jgi:hypothetical protein
MDECLRVAVFSCDKIGIRRLNPACRRRRYVQPNRSVRVRLARWVSSVPFWDALHSYHAERGH